MERKVFCFGTTMTIIFVGLLSADSQGMYIGGVSIGRRQEDMVTGPVYIQSPGDTLYSFHTPATWPSGLAWDGQYFWNTDADSIRIYKLDTLGNIITSFSMPAGHSGHGGLEWDGNFLWLVDETHAKLYKIDPTTGAALKSFSLPDSAASDPNCWGLAWDGSHMWVSQYGFDGRIYEIDTADGSVIFSFPPPSSIMLGMAWHEMYLCGVDAWNGWLYRMNPSDSSVFDSIPWYVPYALGLLWDSTYYWNASGKISIGGNQRIYKVEAPMVAVEEENAFVRRYSGATIFSGALLLPEGKKCRVFDITGRAVLPEKLKPGIYFVEIDGEIVWKVVKVR